MRESINEIGQYLCEVSQHLSEQSRKPWCARSGAGEQGESILEETGKWHLIGSQFGILYNPAGIEGVIKKSGDECQKNATFIKKE